MRRKLPSMRALESFEAVARLGNVTRAAEELGRTQGAVSRSIAGLEEYIGHELFFRDRRQLILKEAARAYLNKVVSILDSLERETQSIISMRDEENVLRLGVLPTLASRWLMPKLAGYLTDGSSTELHLVKGLGRTDFEKQQVDIAIECSQEAPEGLVSRNLFNEEVVAVISPELYKTNEKKKYNKLIMPARSEAWDIWSHARKGPAASTSTLFENYMMMIEAACLGLGVAVVPTIYVDQDIESGRLITPFGKPILSGRAYWLTYTELSSRKQKVVDFVNWLSTRKG